MPDPFGSPKKRLRQHKRRSILTGVSIGRLAVTAYFSLVVLTILAQFYWTGKPRRKQIGANAYWSAQGIAGIQLPTLLKTEKIPAHPGVKEVVTNSGWGPSTNGR